MVQNPLHIFIGCDFVTLSDIFALTLKTSVGVVGTVLDDFPFATPFGFHIKPLQTLHQC